MVPVTKPATAVGGPYKALLAEHDPAVLVTSLHQRQHRQPPP